MKTLDDAYNDVLKAMAWYYGTIIVISLIVLIVSICGLVFDIKIY